MAVPNMIVTIAANATKLVGGLRTASSSIDKFGRAGTAALKGFAASAAIAFVSFATDAVKAASNLEQAIGGTEAVFGAFASKMQKNSEKAAKGLGLSMEQYQRLGAMTGTLLKGAGVPMDKLVDKTDTLLTLAADLAATFGGTVEEAATAMNAALRGEFEPIRRFGISLSQAAIQQEALRISGKKRIDELTPANKIQAAQNLLLEQGADASGQFARESDTLAAKQQILNAEWTNLSTIFGEKLLPFVSEVVGDLSDYFGSAQGKKDLDEAVVAFQTMAGAMKEMYGFLKQVKGALTEIKPLLDVIQQVLELMFPALNLVNELWGRGAINSGKLGGNPSAPGGPRPRSAPSFAPSVVVNFNSPVDSVSAGREVARVLSDYNRARGIA